MNDEMDELEFVRAMFFSSYADFAAAREEDARPKRKSRAASAEIKALRLIVRGFNVIESLGPNQTAAALNYVQDRYGKVLDPRLLR